MAESTLDQVLAAIRGHRFTFASEDELQQGLAAVLAGAALDVQREVRFDAESRIDLLVDRVGIEVKIRGALEAVNRQLCRYAPYVDHLVLVTVSAGHHHHLPAEIDGTPLTVEFIARSGL